MAGEGMYISVRGHISMLLITVFECQNSRCAAPRAIPVPAIGGISRNITEKTARVALGLQE
jgi:hypothetical protein